MRFLENQAITQQDPSRFLNAELVYQKLKWQVETGEVTFVYGADDSGKTNHYQ